MGSKPSQGTKYFSRLRRGLILGLFGWSGSYLLGKFSGAATQELPNNPIVDSKPELPTNPIPTPSPQPLEVSNQDQKVELREKTLNSILLYQTIINLKDSEQLLNIGLANQAPQANSNISSYGDQEFSELVKYHRGAITTNGTFFSKDEEKRVMGNMVAAGRFLKYSQWENYGTTLGIKGGNQLEMTTARVEGQPNWENHWFSITCGPRLLKQGEIWLNPEQEGFQDPHIFDAGWRNAIGFPSSGDFLYLVTFQAILTLKEEAELMKALGCVEAMNLDGGASRALAYREQIIVPAGRKLTNVIVAYDRLNPAPEYLKQSWRDFQNGARAKIPR